MRFLRDTTSQIIAGIVFGVILGLFLKQWNWTDRELMYLQFPGELFLRSVNCLILPLVVSCIISASSDISNNSNSESKIGTKAFVYYFTTTTLGIGLSVFLTRTIRPGEWSNKTGLNLQKHKHKDADSTPKFVTTDILLDLVRNLLPENLVQATLAQYQTVLKQDHPEPSFMSISHRYSPGTNVLGLVLAGLIFGLTLGSSKIPPGKAEPLKSFFGSLYEATSRITDSLIKLAPIAVVFLISGKILKTEGALTETLESLGVFVFTVFVGLLVQAFLVYPLIYILATKGNSPLKIMRNIAPALVTAFATSSSTATVPTTIRCLDALDIDKRVSRFLVPIGATINMDGIALYETIGALFVMQLRGIELSLIQTIAISITCTVSCVGAAGIPSGGYAMLIMVLNSLGVPADDVALIIAVDTFVDRLRTMVNIVADCLGSGVISHLVLKSEQQDPQKYYKSVPIKN